jgi:HEAT repeat protein
MGTVDELIRQLESGDERARRQAAHALGDHHDPRAIDALIRTLEDSSVGYDVRAEAARALGRIGDTKAVEPLIRTMANETGWDVGTLFTAIVEALGAFRDPQITDALVKALGYGYQTARTAAETLKKHRGRRAVEPLIRILDDDAAGHGTHTRQFAAELLGVLGDPRAIPALAKALREEEDCELYILQLFCEEIRKAASKSLLAFVPTHHDAILRLPPEDRHLLGRFIQDAEREELSQEICK